ncbi:MAG: MBL fold metallo-hydrolase [Spirulinaceae cyanobacterium]
MSLFYSDESQANWPNALTGTTAKLLNPVFEFIFAFSPNRETLGGTAYLIVEKAGNILIDCPSPNPEIADFIAEMGGIAWLVLTHRGGIGSNVKALQAKFGCAIAIQEQAAYLLPQVEVTPFASELTLSDDCTVFWTPGHSPGSSCLYCARNGGILFTGRHLLSHPVNSEAATEGFAIAPLRRPKTFHWPRQLQSVEALKKRFSPETLEYLCPGANIGFLRGAVAVKDAYHHLSAIDCQALRHAKIIS